LLVFVDEERILAEMIGAYQRNKSGARNRADLLLAQD
jgi:hypothetical protein